MKDLHKKALEAYIKMLTIHIDTKNKDDLLHAETEAYYLKLFDVAHRVGERHVDLGWEFESSSVDEKKKQVVDIISGLRTDIEEYSKSNDISLGTHGLLASLASDLEDIEWSSKVFEN